MTIRRKRWLNLASLADFCASYHPQTGRPITISKSHGTPSTDGHGGGDADGSAKTDRINPAAAQRAVGPMEGRRVLSDIGRALGRVRSGIHQWLALRGGIAPPVRRRSPRSLSIAEREAISRGLSKAQSIRRIAADLGRAPATVSREVSLRCQRHVINAGAHRAFDAFDEDRQSRGQFASKQRTHRCPLVRAARRHALPRGPQHLGRIAGSSYRQHAKYQWVQDQQLQTKLCELEGSSQYLRDTAMA